MSRQPIDMVGRKVLLDDGLTEVKIVAHSSAPAYLVEFEDGTRQIRSESTIPTTPPATLPTEPTLGWLSGPESFPLFDEWHWQRTGEVYGPITKSLIARDEVTAFTPAIAVPTAALDALRVGQARVTVSALWDAIDTFLAAIDKANEATR